MKSRVILHPVFILHARLFKDSSLLLDALTKDHGRISLLAHGVRSKTRRSLRGILQPFVPLLMSWSGKTELLTMGSVEAVGLPYYLNGKKLISGFYLNELVMRLLHRYDPHPNIYNAYKNALISLQENNSIELTLRLFEQCFLKELGYGISLEIFDDVEVLRKAKYLMRAALKTLLGEKIIKSRELFA